MSSLRRRDQAHELPKEATEVDQMSTGETRKPDTTPVVGSGQEFAPEAADTQEFAELHDPNAKVVQVVLERAPKTRGAVSRGGPQLHLLVKMLGFLFVSTVLWGLLQVYQVSVTSLCSFHPLLCPHEPKVPPPWTDLLSMESDIFEHLLKDMVMGYSMSIDVKAAQMKITDLRTLIRGASGRSQKDLLADDFSELLNEAKKSGKDLQTFASNIGQSFERIMGANDWALQRIKRDISPNESPRVLGLPLTTVETSVTSNFEDAMDALDGSLEVMGSDVDSNSSNLRRIDKNLKAIMRSLGGGSDDVQGSALTHHPSNVDESPTNSKQLERCLEGLKDLQSYVDQANYVIGSAYSVIRDAKQQLEAIRGRLSWEVGWSESALDEKHITAIAIGLEILEEKRAKAKSAQEEILARKVQ